MESYVLKKSSFVVDNQKHIIQACELCKYSLTNYLEDNGKSDSTTRNYMDYNIFSWSSTDQYMYDLFKEIRNEIRSYVGNDKRMWFQSWLNYSTYSDLRTDLGPHQHDWDIHGYVTIEPKHTITSFYDQTVDTPKFQIKNEVGNIYIGPAGPDYKHQVINTKPWSGSRITIAFDCTFDPNYIVANNNVLFPLL